MASKGKVNKELEKIIAKLLKEVNTATTEGDGKPVYSLTDKMKVIDRALKLEAIRMKADDAGYGTGFGADPEETEE